MTLRIDYHQVSIQRWSLTLDTLVVDERSPLKIWFDCIQMEHTTIQGVGGPPKAYQDGGHFSHTHTGVNEPRSDL